MGTHLVLAFGAQWGWGAWSWLVIPLVLYGLVSLALFGFGQTDEPELVRFFFGQISDSLERATGFPGWSMAGVLSGLLFLLVLVIGFYWDVAWHMDFGRDTQLFTVPHVMILVGLGGLIYAAAIAVWFASLDRAEVGLRIGPVRIPWSAILLAALGAGAIAAFPLDNLWHQTYGIDVTLWSPTHLQLVTGGSFGTVALFLMCAEALPSAHPKWLGKGIHILTAGTILVAVSTFQGEFDYGVPQFQVLYLPLLIVAAATFALVLARVALGPGGALEAVLVYLVLRGFLAFVVAGALHHTLPRFALYLPSALAVEAAAWWLGSRPRLRLALAAGALAGTVGLAGELAWVAAMGWSSGRLPVDLLVKIVVLAPLAAVAAGVLGAGLARAYTNDHDHVPVAALALAGVVLVGVLAYPLPRHVGRVDAVIRLQQAGDRAMVDVELQPPDAARHAIAFVVTSWQGGGRETASLEEVAPGRYRSSKAVPVVGRWKSTVSLLRGSQVMAAPVYMPADPAIGAPALPALAERRTPFVRNTKLLLREAHPGPAGAAVAAWSGLALLVALWVALMAVTARRTGAGFGADHGPDAGEPAPPAPQWVPGRTLASLRS